MDFLESLQGQLNEISPVLTTKSELVEYYQERYAAKGRGSWRQEIVSELASITGMKPKNLERRFDPSRLANVPRTTREKEQYIKLGELIGRTPPKNGYSVTFHGEIRISNQCKYCQFFSLLIDGEEADELAATDDIYIIFREYFQGLDMAEGFCGQPEITIEPAQEGQTQMKFAHGPQGSKFAGIFG